MEFCNLGKQYQMRFHMLSVSLSRQSFMPEGESRTSREMGKLQQLVPYIFDFKPTALYSLKEPSAIHCLGFQRNN